MTTDHYPTFEKYLRNEYRGPYVATDIIIRYPDTQGNPGIVLIERKGTPYGIALPGGIAERMSLPANAVKEAKEETGLDIVIDGPEFKPFHVSSDPRRDPRAFIIGVTYTAQGFGKLAPHPNEDAKRAFIVPIKDLEQFVTTRPFAFEAHRETIGEYLKACVQGEVHR